MPDFQIARLPDFRDISGTEAEVRAHTAAGVDAAEAEHTSGRTVGPEAPAKHAAPPLSRHIPHGLYSFDFFQPPSIRPISFSSL
ncbi:hypothetical protein CLOM621_08307, partial [Clostridium sp. M62/1]